MTDISRVIKNFVRPSYEKIRLMLWIGIFLYAMTIASIFWVMKDSIYFPIYEISFLLSAWYILIFPMGDAGILALGAIYSYLIACALKGIYDDIDQISRYLMRVTAMLVIAVGLFSPPLSIVLFAIGALGTIPFFRMSTEIRLKTEKEVDEAFPEIEGPNGPVMKLYRKKGFSTEKIGKGRFMLQKGNILLETRTVDEVPEKFSYSDSYINGVKFSEGKAYFKKLKNGTEITIKESVVKRVSGAYLIASYIGKSAIVKGFESEGYNAGMMRIRAGF